MSLQSERIQLLMEFIDRHQHANARLPVRLLRINCDRPCCRTTNQRDEFAPSHCRLWGLRTGIVTV